MKRILVIAILSTLAFGVYAQDVKSIKKLFDKPDLVTAKAQIDALVEKNPTNAEDLYLQSKIYAAISVSDQMKNTVPDARTIAFEAFKKAIQNQKGNTEYMKMMVMDKQFYKPLIDIYSGYYDAGAALFNSGAAKSSKAEFEHSMDMFINADKVGHFIAEQKLGLSDLDTNLVLNIGKSALNAGKTDIAVPYLRKLADAGVYRTKDATAGYELSYQWLTLHYKTAKNETDMLKYANLGKQFYPKDDYYDAVLLDYYRDKKDHDALFKQYQKITTAFPDSINYHFNYANDAFNSIYNGDEGSKVSNREELLKTITTELGTAIKLKPEDVNTNWLYGQYYFNQGVEIKDKARLLKGTTPADVKKKAEINVQAQQSFNLAIPYAEKAMSILEAGKRKSEKSRYKSIADLMERIYQGLQKSDKVKFYQEKYDSADSKFIN